MELSPTLDRNTVLTCSHQVLLSQVSNTCRSSNMWHTGWSLYAPQLPGSSVVRQHICTPGSENLPLRRLQTSLLLDDEVTVQCNCSCKYFGRAAWSSWQSHRYGRETDLRVVLEGMQDSGTLSVTGATIDEWLLQHHSIVPQSKDVV